MMHFKGLLSETMRAVFTLVCLPLMLSGCGGAPTPQETPSPDGQTPATSTITTGDAVSSGGGALDAGHGVITVDTADSPLKGLTVEVPEGAYSQPTAFNVSYRPILADNLPEGAEPISPLIMIDNGGRAADDLMVITVPISISESEFATAFRYNAAEDRLDALPLVDSSATAVSVAVRRFGSSAGSASAKLVRNLAASDAAQGPEGTVVVKFRKADLQNLNVSTEFKPEADGWQFTNHGSYPDPAGICSGMTISALWYYVERRVHSAPQLRETYGSSSLPAGHATTGFIIDDDLAYKICTAAQHITVSVTDKYYNMLEHRGISPYFTRDESNFYAIAASLFVNRANKIPEYLAVSTANWKFRHAILCYAISGNTLSVLDPNWPGQPRTITFQDGKFQPYGSGLNADDSTVQFTNIRGMGGRDAVFYWDEIGDLFEAADTGATGMNSGIFPDARLRIVELNEQGGVVDNYEADLLQDNTVSHRQIRVELASPAGFQGKLRTYQYASPPTLLVDPPLTLQVGNNLFGFHIEGFIKYTTPQPDGTEAERTAWRWAGFHWINFVYRPTDIKPTVTIESPTAGQSFTAGDAVKLKATAKDSAGSDVPADKVVWTSSADGPLGTGQDLSVTSLSVGGHTLTVTATDLNGNQASASVQITIKAPDSGDCPVPPGAVLKTSGFTEYYWLDGVGEVGPTRVWTSAARTQLTHEACRNAQGQYHGWFRNWEPDGTLTAEIQYANGKYNGVYRHFDSDNGRMVLEEHYANGDYEGLARAWYYQNGQIKYEMTYSADKLNGPYKSWNQNGNPEVETAYVAGVENGTRREWAEDGTLKWTCTIDHGTTVECH